MALLLEELWWIPCTEEDSDEVCTRSVSIRASNALEGLLCTVSTLASLAFPRPQDPLVRLANGLGTADKVVIPYLTMHNLGSSVPRVDSKTDSESSTSSSSSVSSKNGFVFSKGIGFAGQVFGLYSSTRNCLVGVEEKRYLRNIPFMGSFVRSWLSKMLRLDDVKGPAFQFYISHDDAKAYLKRLRVSDMEVGSVPLHLAYKFFKERPALFRFIPPKKQVRIAKALLKKEHGGKAAQEFSGVPVFSSQSLSILVVSPTTARWFRPYFFKKEELDDVIKTSMEHHFQSVIRNRSARRHSQLGDFPSDLGDDDLEMLDSQDMQDFMEDMDEWSSILESIMAKAAQIYFQDALDKAIFGNKWCRMLAGIQPKFPILVDSFERRITGKRGYFEKEKSVNDANTKGDGILGKLLNESSERDDEDDMDKEIPHLTVVAGIAGSSAEQVVRAASNAIQEAKERIGKNEMPLENLFIADLGGPQVWSNPGSSLSGFGSNHEPPSST